MQAAGSPSGPPPPGDDDDDDDVPSGATPVAAEHNKRPLPSWSPSSSESSSHASPAFLAPQKFDWMGAPIDSPAVADLLGAQPVADESPAPVIISPMLPRILGEEFEAVLQQASELPAAVPSPQQSTSEVRVYKRGLRALLGGMMLAQKAAEAIAEAAAEAAEAAEALAAAMPSPAEVAEAEWLLFDGRGSQSDYAAEDAADAAWAAAALAAAMPSPAEVAEVVAEVVEELVHLVSWDENRQARYDERVALGPFCVHEEEEEEEEEPEEEPELALEPELAPEPFTADLLSVAEHARGWQMIADW